MKKVFNKNLLGQKPPGLVIENTKKYDKMISVLTDKEGNIIDYRKIPGSLDPKVYTVESVTGEGLKLFQVGSYQNPLTFRSEGFCMTQFRSKNWVNWDRYYIIPYNKAMENVNV